MESNEIKNLENRIDQLIDFCRQLKQEIDSLKSENKGLVDERVQLMEKTKVARTRIEAMIGRLKTLERG